MKLSSKWKSLFYVMIIIILFFSCKEKIKKLEGIEYKLTYYSNGNLKIKGEYLNDSIKHGEFILYYKNGQIKKRRVYKNNVIDGWIYSFYENGKIKDSMFYDNGSLSGKSYWYYSNGRLEHIGNWRNDSSYGGNFYYYMNGNIEVYACDDVCDEVLYRIEWDSLGNIIEEAGRIFSCHLRVDKDVILVNDTINASFTVSLPPYAKTEIYIGDVRNNTIENLQECKVKNWTANFTKVYQDTGVNKVGIIGILKNDSNKMIWSDTLIKSLYVNPN